MTNESKIKEPERNQKKVQVEHQTEHLAIREICESAVNLYGYKEQAGQAMEECGELIVALHKYFYRRGNFEPMHLAEEIADVQIMCEQLDIIFEKQGYGEIVKHARFNKLKRLNGNIAKDVIAGQQLECA